MTIATYLTGQRVSLRALGSDDANVAEAWHPAPYGLNASRGESVVKEEQENTRNRKRLGVVLTDSGELIGGVQIEHRLLHAHVEITIARRREGQDADALRADVLRLVVPWLRDEGEYSVVGVDLAGDWMESIAAAQELGMQQTARLREWFARPGGRTDLVIYSAVNPFWESPQMQAARRQRENGDDHALA